MIGAELLKPSPGATVSQLPERNQAPFPAANM